MTTSSNNSATNPIIDSLSNGAGQLWRIAKSATKASAKTVELGAVTTAAVLEAAEIGTDKAIQAVSMSPEEIEEGLQVILAGFTTNTTNKLTAE